MTFREYIDAYDDDDEPSPEELAARQRAAARTHARERIGNAINQHVYNFIGSPMGQALAHAQTGSLGNGGQGLMPRSGSWGGETEPVSTKFDPNRYGRRAIVRDMMRGTWNKGFKSGHRPRLSSDRNSYKFSVIIDANPKNSKPENRRDLVRQAWHELESHHDVIQGANHGHYNMADFSMEQPQLVDGGTKWKMVFSAPARS